MQTSRQSYSTVLYGSESCKLYQKFIDLPDELYKSYLCSICGYARQNRISDTDQEEYWIHHNWDGQEIRFQKSSSKASFMTEKKDGQSYDRHKNKLKKKKNYSFEYTYWSNKGSFFSSKGFEDKLKQSR